MSGNPNPGSAQSGGRNSPPGMSFGGGYSPPSAPTPAQPTLAPPTPPNNPTPAVMPQRGPGSSYDGREGEIGGYNPFGPRGFDRNLPADQVRQEDMFRRGPFGRREQPAGVPTWSQQGGIYSYDPNGRPDGMPGGWNPWGPRTPPTPGTMPDPALVRQQFMQWLQGQQQPAPATGLGAINPFMSQDPASGGSIL